MVLLLQMKQDNVLIKILFILAQSITLKPHNPTPHSTIGVTKV